jgi:hypothetical protein
MAAPVSFSRWLGGHAATPAERQYVPDRQPPVIVPLNYARQVRVVVEVEVIPPALRPISPRLAEAGGPRNPKAVGPSGHDLTPAPPGRKVVHTGGVKERTPGKLFDKTLSGASAGKPKPFLALAISASRSSSLRAAMLQMRGFSTGHVLNAASSLTTPSQKPGTEHPRRRYNAH